MPLCSESDFCGIFLQVFNEIFFYFVINDVCFYSLLFSYLCMSCYKLLKPRLFFQEEKSFLLVFINHEQY